MLNTRGAQISTMSITQTVSSTYPYEYYSIHNIPLNSVTATNTASAKPKIMKQFVHSVPVLKGILSPVQHQRNKNTGIPKRVNFSIPVTLALRLFDPDSPACQTCLKPIARSTSLSRLQYAQLDSDTVEPLYTTHRIQTSVIKSQTAQNTFSSEAGGIAVGSGRIALIRPTTHYPRISYVRNRTTSRSAYEIGTGTDAAISRGIRDATSTNQTSGTSTGRTESCIYSFNQRLRMFRRRLYQSTDSLPKCSIEANEHFVREETNAPTSFEGASVAEPSYWNALSMDSNQQTPTRKTNSCAAHIQVQIFV